MPNPTDTDAKKVRCPYCCKVFLYRFKGVQGTAGTVSLVCPHCAETIALPRKALCTPSTPSAEQL